MGTDDAATLVRAALRAAGKDDDVAVHDPTQNAALAKPVLVRLGFDAEIANETTRAAVPTWAWRR